MKYLLLFFFVLPIYSQAQFSGGFGDGATSGVVNTTMDGQSPALFLGGIADGADRQISVSLTMIADCDYVLILNQVPVNPGTYKAASQIVTSGSVASGSVTLQASESFVFTPNFEVKIGATLLTKKSGL